MTSLVVNKGVDPLDILIVFTSIIPSFLEIAIPMSVLLGTMLAFARMSLDSEIVVLRASGVSLGTLVRPVFIFGLIATLVSLITSIYLRPLGNYSLSNQLFKLASLSTTSSLTEGVFNKLGTLTIYAEKISKTDSSLEHVLIDDRRDPKQRLIITSHQGALTSDGQTKMINLKLSNGSIHSAKIDGTYNVTQFVDNDIKIDPQELANKNEASGKKAREMFLPELKIAILDLQLSHANDTKIPEIYKESLATYQIELARKFSMPFACLILGLLAMPLGIHPPRSHNSLGQALSLMVGLIVFICYYALLSVGMSLSKQGSVHAFLGVWIPNLTFFLITLMALNQMGSEKWNSLLHAVNDGVNSVTKKVSSLWS